jgi:hypothetical protein
VLTACLYHHVYKPSRPRGPLTSFLPSLALYYSNKRRSSHASQALRAVLVTTRMWRPPWTWSTICPRYRGTCRDNNGNTRNDFGRGVLPVQCWYQCSHCLLQVPGRGVAAWPRGRLSTGKTSPTPAKETSPQLVAAEPWHWEFNMAMRSVYQLFVFCLSNQNLPMSKCIPSVLLAT